MTASQWDGNLEAVASARTPVYLAIGENDSYYGADSLKDAYATLYGLYEEQGLKSEQIEELLVLDVRPQSYFTERGFQDQHAGGQSFARDEEVMGWLFSKVKRSALSGTIPEELEYIPDGYVQPSGQSGDTGKAGIPDLGISLV